MNALVTLTVTCAITSMSAQAEIIYVELNQTSSDGGYHHENISIAGEEFRFGGGPAGQGLTYWKYVRPSSSQAFIDVTPQYEYGQYSPAHYSEGETIDLTAVGAWQSQPAVGTWTDSFYGSDGMGMSEIYFDGWSYAGGYVGFAIGSGSDRKFGWMHFQNINHVGLTLTGWAYNNVAGESITAGQTESATAVPGAGGLLALACGAAGFRRRRNRATTA